MAKSKRRHYQFRRIIARARAYLWRLKIKVIKTRIGKFDIILFFRQLATLLKAGLPIIKALTLLAGNQSKIPLKNLILSIRQQLLTGSSLANTIGRHETYFEPWIRHLINLGEHTGKLTDILTSIAEQQEKQWQLEKRLLTIIFYPCLICLVAIFVLLFLLLVIVPQFQSFFNDIKTELPLITEIIFMSSNILRIAGIPLGILFFGILLANLTTLTSKKNAVSFFRNLPLFRNFTQKTLFALWCNRLALTLAAGIPIIQALTLMSTFDGIGRQQTLHAICERLKCGEAFHRALASEQFPLLLVQMVQVGEESGQLEFMLQKVGEFYEKEAELALNFFCQLLDPLIMLGLGALIGGLLIGIYLPIFNLGTRI